jgi:hypothetical protein
MNKDLDFRLHPAVLVSRLLHARLLCAGLHTFIFTALSGLFIPLAIPA